MKSVGTFAAGSCLVFVIATGVQAQEQKFVAKRIQMDMIAAMLSAVSQDQKPPAKHVEVDLGGGIKMKLVRIEPGKFMMGALSKGEQDFIRNYKGEKPIDQEKLHEVEITRPFYMGVYAVTQAEYEKVMGKNPSYFSRDGAGKKEVAGTDTARFPVEYVSWEDAMEFCTKLGKKQGKTFDLPTEAEWEFACRGGTKTAFHYGNSLSSAQANFDGTRPYGQADKGPWLNRPTPVGSYKPNAFGLYDMHGNVRQCCKDWYKRDYYDESPPRDPQGPLSGTARVTRGGSWYDAAWYCRSAFRLATPPGDRINYMQGFRVVLRLP
jgi:formylglycine-generating enzyme required for sulfatase activity